MLDVLGRNPWYILRLHCHWSHSEPHYPGWWENPGRHIEIWWFVSGCRCQVGLHFVVLSSPRSTAMCGGNGFPYGKNAPNPGPPRFLSFEAEGLARSYHIHCLKWEDLKFNNRPRVPASKGALIFFSELLWTCFDAKEISVVYLILPTLLELPWRNIIRN